MNGKSDTKEAVAWISVTYERHAAHWSRFSVKSRGAAHCGFLMASPTHARHRLSDSKAARSQRDTLFTSLSAMLALERRRRAIALLAYRRRQGKKSTGNIGSTRLWQKKNDIFTSSKSKSSFPSKVILDLRTEDSNWVSGTGWLRLGSTKNL